MAKKATWSRDIIKLAQYHKKESYINHDFPLNGFPFIITTLTLFCNPSYLSLHTGTCIFHISKISYNKIFVIIVMIIIIIRINQSNLINYNCNIRTVIITEIYYCLK